VKQKQSNVEQIVEVLKQVGAGVSPAVVDRILRTARFRSAKPARETRMTLRAGQVLSLRFHL